MHPRTHYLADADKNHDPARQPLLQDSSSKAAQEAAAEPPVSDEKDSGSAAASAPPLSTASGLPPIAEQPPTSAYGLPSGYLAQYAGNFVQQQAHAIFVWQCVHGLVAAANQFVGFGLLQKHRQSSSHLGRQLRLSLLPTSPCSRAIVCRHLEALMMNLPSSPAHNVEQLGRPSHTRYHLSDYTSKGNVHRCKSLCTPSTGLDKRAGEWLLCLVQRHHLHLPRMLAMRLDALLCRVMQRHSAQVQQLW